MNYYHNFLFLLFFLILSLHFQCLVHGLTTQQSTSIVQCLVGYAPGENGKTWRSFEEERRENFSGKSEDGVLGEILSFLPRPGRRPAIFDTKVCKNILWFFYFFQKIKNLNSKKNY